MSSVLSLPTDNKILRIAGTAVSTLLAVMFPVGIIGMTVGMLAQEHLWTSTVFLGVQALLTFILLLAATSAVRAVIVTCGVGAAAVIIEFVGLATGVPFGSYYYSYHLEPFVIANVPLAIVFAWYVLVVNIVLLSRNGARGTRSVAASSLTGGVFILGIDIMLEPFASFVNRYWTWAGGIIPPQNYAAWFLLGTVMIAAVHAALPPKPAQMQTHVIRLPDAILWMTAAQCVIINGLHGYWLPTMAGLVLAAAAYWRLRHVPL